jgi:hypothetical protein
MPESTFLLYHLRLTLPDGSTKQSKQCIRFDTLGPSEYIIGSYAGTENTIHVDTVPICQSHSDSVINAWLEKKCMPRIQDFNLNIPPPGTSFSILYPANTLENNENEDEDENRTRELMIPFIICTDAMAKAAWIVEGDEAIDPDSMGPACIPGSANYNRLLVEVMSSGFGEEGKWNGR